MENQKLPPDSGQSLRVAYIRRKNEDREDDTRSNHSEEDVDSLARVMAYEAHGTTAHQEELVFDIQTGKLRVSPTKIADTERGNRNPVMTKMAAQGYF